MKKNVLLLFGCALLSYACSSSALLGEPPDSVLGHGGPPHGGILNPDRSSPPDRHEACPEGFYCPNHGKRSNCDALSDCAPCSLEDEESHSNESYLTRCRPFDEMRGRRSDVPACSQPGQACVNGSAVPCVSLFSYQPLADQPGCLSCSICNTSNGFREDFPCSVTADLSCTDVAPPQITLLGPVVYYLEAQTEYVDPGYQTRDNSGGSVTVTVSSDLNVQHTGRYSLNYTAADFVGNKAFMSRSIFVVDTRPPVITFIGPEHKVIEGGYIFVDSGVTVWDAVDGPLNDSFVIVDNPLPLYPHILGSYTIQYSARDLSNNYAFTSRNVSVVDRIAPSISLAGGSPYIVEFDTPFVEPGFNVSDLIDVHPRVTVSPAFVNTTVIGANISVLYNAYDFSGNERNATRLVLIRDTTPPVLTLKGKSSITVEIGSTFDDPGVVATDNADGNLTCSVVTISPDFTSAIANSILNITYLVSDSSGNKAPPIVRQLILVDTLPPLVTMFPVSAEIHSGDPFIPPTVLAQDNSSPSLPIKLAKISFQGQEVSFVNTSWVGEFLLDYTAMDASGNTGTSTFTLSVLKAKSNVSSNDHGHSSSVIVIAVVSVILFLVIVFLGLMLLSKTKTFHAKRYAQFGSVYSSRNWLRRFLSPRLTHPNPNLPSVTFRNRHFDPEQIESIEELEDGPRGSGELVELSRFLSDANNDILSPNPSSTSLATTNLQDFQALTTALRALNGIDVFIPEINAQFDSNNLSTSQFLDLGRGHSVVSPSLNEMVFRRFHQLDNWLPTVTQLRNESSLGSGSLNSADTDVSSPDFPEDDLVVARSDRKSTLVQELDSHSYAFPLGSCEPDLLTDNIIATEPIITPSVPQHVASFPKNYDIDEPYLEVMRKEQGDSSCHVEDTTCTPRPPTLRDLLEM